MSSSLCEGYVSVYKGVKLNNDKLKYSVKFIGKDEITSVVELQNRVCGDNKLGLDNSIYKVVNLNFDKKDNISKIFGVYVGGKLVACSLAGDENLESSDLSYLRDGIVHPNFEGNGFEPMLTKIKSDIERVLEIKAIK